MDWRAGKQRWVVMKDVLANDDGAERYVLEVDGQPQLEYRVFVQALSAGLELRRDLPNCRVRLRDYSTSST
jgi:hypothetical protein